MKDKETYSIDEVHNLYNKSVEECPAIDPDSTMLEHGAYTIEEFIWWLKTHNYKFIKKGGQNDIEK